ncbi:MAG: chromate transporter [Acetatifactor sp.]|nr:chromate transporter [Acetatifactor sp.]
MLYLQLFLAFLKVGLFSIGGGYAAIPIIASGVVEGYGWITEAEFADLMTVAEMTPGPIAVNSATFVGMRLLGVPGALVATAGCILPSCIIVSVLFWAYYKYKGLSFLNSVLSALRACVVGLIAAAGLKLLVTALYVGSGSEKTLDPVQLFIFLTAFIALYSKKVNPIPVMLLSGFLGLFIHILIP